MRAAAVTFFRIQARATLMAPVHLCIPANYQLGTAASNYVAVLLSRVAFPLHKIITIVLWNT